MKKFVLIIIMIVICAFETQAQNDTILTIAQVYENEHSVKVCRNKYDRVIIYAPNNCNDYYWFINNVGTSENPVIINGSLYNNLCPCQFGGCGIPTFQFSVWFIDPDVPAETTTELWKHQHETIELNLDTLPLPEYPNNEYYTYLWSTGQTTATIEVTEPDTYICGVSDMCATSMQTFIVRDNVELYRATVDLETNMNKTTWQVTPEQAEYISEVKVYRDGLLVGTAPYEDGYFLDAIGSNNAARNYQIVGVSVEGEDCPIASYQRGTIHTTYYQDVNGNLNMTWNIPYVEEGASGTLTYFQICKYNPNSGDLIVVDQVNAGITDYTCGVNQFDGGQAVIAAVFNDGKGVEKLSFSNLTTDILGIGENGGPSTDSGTLIVYPNPAKGRVTVEGTGTLTITNTLGQTVFTKEIGGKETIELPQGLYFVKCGIVTRKVIVE